MAISNIPNNFNFKDFADHEQTNTVVTIEGRNNDYFIDYNSQFDVYLVCFNEKPYKYCNTVGEAFECIYKKINPLDKLHMQLQMSTMHIKK